MIVQEMCKSRIVLNHAKVFSKLSREVITIRTPPGAHDEHFVKTCEAKFKIRIDCPTTASDDLSRA